MKYGIYGINVGPCSDPEMAVRVAERIRAAVSEFVFNESDSPKRLTVSAGVATYPSGPAVDDAESLIRAGRKFYVADTAAESAALAPPSVDTTHPVR